MCGRSQERKGWAADKKRFWEDKQKGKRRASLSCPLESQVMTRSLWSNKGRNSIQETMGSKKRELIRLTFAETLPLKGKRKDGSKGFCLVWFSDENDVSKFMGLA